MDSCFESNPRKKKLKLLKFLEDQSEEDQGRKIHGHGDGDGDGGCSFDFDNLPRDILLDIVTRLPTSSLIQLRFVCRLWHVLSRDPELCRLHHSAVEKADPTLIFHCDYPIRNELSFVEISSDDGGNGDDDEKAVRKIQTPFCTDMPEFNVVGSCNGLLCLSDSLYGEPVYVFNPFTRDYLKLPNSKQFQEQEVMFGFGFHPETNQYTVVRIVYYRNPCNGNQARRRIIRTNRNYPQSEVQTLTVGNFFWRSLGKVPYQLDRQATEVPVVNGRIHWLSRPGRIGGIPGRTIVSFDLKDEKFKIIAKPSHAMVNRSNFHLAVIRGCLSAVISCGYGKLEIWVMKEYDVKESWSKEVNIHGAYLAKVPSHEAHYGIWKKTLSGRMVRVLCVLNNGEILLEYRGGILVKYDPKWKEFKDFSFPGTGTGTGTGMPKLFQTVVHVGSLNWIN